MTAATLIKCFPNKNITLIERPTVSTVGVGESTLAHIRGWTTLLDIKDKDYDHKKKKFVSVSKNRGNYGKGTKKEK